jgi:hypothetical protein
MEKVLQAIDKDSISQKCDSVLNDWGVSYIDEPFFVCSWTGSCFVAQVGFELLILLCWHYSCVPQAWLNLLFLICKYVCQYAPEKYTDTS